MNMPFNIATSVKPTGTSRRGFLKSVPLAGLVLYVGLPVRGLAADEPKKYGGDAMPQGLRDSPKVFVSIAPDGIVSIVVIRSEMGQGVRTSLPMIVADELEADWKRVRVRAGARRRGQVRQPGHRRLAQHAPLASTPMRRCGASARTMLEQAAADTWKVPLDQVQAKNHEVVHKPTGRKLGYGALALAAAKLDVPAAASVRLKQPSEFRYIGKNDTFLTDGQAIVTGKAQYGIDTRLPGMLYAVIARPPVLGGKVKSFDAAEALKVPGVVKVFALEGTPPPSEFQPIGGIVVVAKDTWAAIKGRSQLKIEWDDGPHASYDSAEFRNELEAAVQKTGGKAVRNEGDAYSALAKAAKKVEANYYVPHFAHASMECPAATARIVGGACEVWACTQSPQAAHDRVAKRLNLPPEKVTVNVTLLGGGFGRKSKADFVVEAALVSQAMDGQPVKLTWTREDDLHHDYFHTVSRATPRSRDRCQRQDHRLAAPHRRADDHLDLRARPQTARDVRTRPGIDGHAVRDPERAHRESASRGARAHRLAALGQQHPACVRRAVVRRRARTGPGQGPPRLPARVAGPGPADRPDQDQRAVESRRITRALPDQHRPPAQGGRTGHAGGEAGAASCRAGKGWAWRCTTAS